MSDTKESANVMCVWSCVHFMHALNDQVSHVKIYMYIHSIIGYWMMLIWIRLFTNKNKIDASERTEPFFQ